MSSSLSSPSPHQHQDEDDTSNIISPTAATTTTPTTNTTSAAAAAATTTTELNETNRISASIIQLPRDVLLQIGLYMPFASFFPMRLTCSHLNEQFTDPLLYKMKYHVEFAGVVGGDDSAAGGDDDQVREEEEDLSPWVLRYINTYFEKKAWRFGAEHCTIFSHILHDYVHQSFAFLLKFSQTEQSYPHTMLNRNFLSHNDIEQQHHLMGGYNVETTPTRSASNLDPHRNGGGGESLKFSNRSSLRVSRQILRPNSSSYTPVRCFLYAPSSVNYPSIQFHQDDCPFLQYDDVKFFECKQYGCWVAITKHNTLRANMNGINVKPFELTPYTVNDLHILSKKYVLIWASTAQGQKLLLFQLKQNKFHLIRERLLKFVESARQCWQVKRMGKHLYVYISHSQKCNIHITDMSSDNDKWITCPIPKKVRKRGLLFRDIVNIKNTPYIMVSMREETDHKSKSPSLLLFIDNAGNPMPGTAKQGKLVDQYWTFKNMVCVHTESKRELRVLRFLMESKDVFIEDAFQLRYSSRLQNPMVAFDQAKLVLYSRRELFIYCIKTGNRTQHFDLRNLDASDWDYFLAQEVEEASITLLQNRWIDLFFKGSFRSLWMRIEHPMLS